MVIPIGGGKTAVHIHRFNPKKDTPENHREERDAISRDLMHVYDAINRKLGNGGFVAEDQNMTERDMQVMFEAVDENPWVLPNSDRANNEHPSSYTMLGVVKGLERAIPFVPGLEWRAGQDNLLEDKAVAVQGIGNIGKELIREFYPDLESINDVAYKTENLVFVHIAHPSPGNGHFFTWLNSSEGIQAHKRKLAIEAIRDYS